MSKTKEAFRLIHAELVDLGGVIRGLQESIGKYHYDIKGEGDRRDAENERLKERLGRAESRIGVIETAVRKHAPAR